MAVRVLSVESTDLFVGSEEQPRQVVRVRVDRGDGSAALPVTVSGRGLDGAADVPAGAGEVVVEVPIATASPVGAEIPVVARAGDAEADGLVVVEETGWRMFLVSHFHYDPVWWNTQAAYTETWALVGDDGATRPVWEHNAFMLVRAHLEMALSDPDYAFVLAEVDYLKPFWDVFPEYRSVLRELIAAGRVEIMGGTYNEPNTNLTGAETTIRNLVYGVGYQKTIMGADPRTAWQLDVFGHDPQFPGLVADAGLTSTSWARGPFHQWGPMLTKFNEKAGDARNMQFPAEFEWISPSGRGVVTHYMPNHYSAGWWMDSSATLAEAEEKVYELFAGLKPAAATRNTLLPVGTDYTPPNKWVTEIHRDWARRYVWPKFVCATPKDFFAAVAAELAERGVAPSPQTRDMNPVYTGKDVSYIDTKQAQRAAEVAATDAEKLATFATLLGLGRYPESALDKVWRQLAYGAHHDAITGSESDQVYIDLVTGWREAHDLAADVRDRALTAILGRVDTRGDGRAITVTNTLAFRRTDLVRVSIPVERGLRLVDDTGAETPFVVEAEADGSAVVAFVAADVPGMGWRTWRALPGASLPRWVEGEGVEVANEHYTVTADPARGGALCGIREARGGRELLRHGQVGNELRLYDEYPQHPQFGEGPWHLVPTGAVVSSADLPGTVRVEHSPAGSRIIATGRVGDVPYEQRTTLWRGLDRIDLRTRVLEYSGKDKLLRVKFPVDVPGARPVSEVGGAVIARGFALPESDSAQAPWTLDNPANTFFGVSTTACLDLRTRAGAELGRAALAVAEVVVPDLADAAPYARDLVVALARVGVTATTATAEGARYGWLRVDSNLPDVRIVLGGPEVNPLAADLLDRAGAPYRDELKRLLDEHGAARLFVPAETSVERAWVANADLRDVRALPALVVAGSDASSLAAEIAALAAEFATRTRAEAIAVDTGEMVLADDHTVGLLSTGMPGFAVDPTGALHLSLMRSCSGWPSGIWLDPPLRRSPDGSPFQWQHWTHDFDYALVSGSGDWRSTDLVARGHAFSSSLLARSVEAHGGDLPSRHALLEVSPERRVQVLTVKPEGNPSATGGSAHGPGMTVRLVETTGQSADATVSTPFGWVGGHRTDLLESERRDNVFGHDTLAVPLDGAEIATVVGQPGSVHGDGAEIATNVGQLGQAGAGSPVLGATAEPAQPVYARYWLHNRGPAPLGFLPVSVTAAPTVLTGAGTVAVTVASHLVDAEFTGELTVVPPSGWDVEPRTRPVYLAPGAHTAIPVTLTPPSEGGSGPRFVRVQLRVGADVVEDVVTVLAPDSPLLPPPLGEEIAHELQIQGTTADTARPTGLAITGGTERVEVAAGGRATVAVTVTSQAADPIDGEAMPVSPWGTWRFVHPFSRGFRVEPGGTTDVVFDVDVPADAEPGQWWVMVKLMWFGRVQYGPAVPLVVTR